MDLNSILNPELPFTEISLNDLVYLYNLGGHEKLTSILKLLDTLASEPEGETVSSHKLYRVLKSNSHFFDHLCGLIASYEELHPGMLNCTPEVRSKWMPSLFSTLPTGKQYYDFLCILEKNLQQWFSEYHE